MATLAHKSINATSISAELLPLPLPEDRPVVPTKDSIFVRDVDTVGLYIDAILLLLYSMPVLSTQKIDRRQKISQRESLSSKH